MTKRTCAVAGCSRPHIAKGYCDYHYRVLANPKQRVARTRTCEVCLGQYTTKRDAKRARVCSLTCRWFIDDRYPKQYPLRQCQGCERWVPNRTGVWCSDECYTRSVTKEPRVVPRFHGGRCRGCGDYFVDRWNDRPAHYCSVRCARYDHRARRRARQRGAYVAPVNRRAIFERDGWCCQICGEGVDRDTVVPHPWAPTIDHVIPLARGGTHEPANVQCAHHWCNSVKNDGRWGTLEALGLTA